ncbi:hypothetical protein I6F48_00990 [Pseudoalteromonas sp. SWYJ118]|nr:hypothetical protein [Pseudoalteromonas sp. SWYJ118]MBH0074141.1 hypothetical protein [Pseudoalteromonas sp. SWYJ118]
MVNTFSYSIRSGLDRVIDLMSNKSKYLVCSQSLVPWFLQLTEGLISS